MRGIVFFLSVLFLTGLTSCDDSQIYVTGKVGEILVVCDDAIWDSHIRNELDSGLTQFIMPYFPDVTTFELIHRNPRTFNGPIKRHRNILFLSVNPEDTDGIVRYEENVWANRQTVIRLEGRDKNHLLQIVKSKIDKIHDQFDLKEWSRIRKYFAEQQDENINNKLATFFKIHLDLPYGSKIVAKRNNFFRIEIPEASRPIEFVGSGQQDVGTIYSGIMVYQYPFIDSSQLEFTPLMRARDTMLKYNVPHETYGLYMGTQYNEFVHPEYSMDLNYNGSIEGVEVRGMFVFKGRYKHSTGGAFWSFHFVHPKTNKILCISGYVDAPSTTSWTHALREIQAVWKSVTLL